jgi:uncharacterized protein YbjQ (UPF0145 family)
MPLFHHKSDAEQHAQEDRNRFQAQSQDDQAESLRLLQAGGIPVQARRRLEELAKDPNHLFTSDLSVPEFLLARHEGMRAITQVMGSCFYHVGFRGLLMQGQYWADSWEMTAVTQAYDNARTIALGRLRQEAQLVGATAVVGVRLKRVEYEWGSDTIEYTAVGTAVHIEGAPLAAEPALTTFSGEDFWKLLQAGYGPVGVAAGSCVFYQAGWDTANMSSFWGSGWANQELGDLTRGIRTARSIAQTHLHRSAESLGAEGVVGVDISQRQHDYEIDRGGITRTDIIFTYLMLGTAIAPLKHARSPHKVSAVMAMSGRGLSRKKTDDTLGE